jgi:hypothetical protein
MVAEVPQAEHPVLYLMQLHQEQHYTQLHQGIRERLIMPNLLVMQEQP